jgi:hypothetical protein
MIVNRRPCTRVHMTTHPLLSIGSISSRNVKLQILNSDSRILIDPPAKAKSLAKAPTRLPNATTQMSRKSRRGLTLQVRNAPSYSHFLTLSYGRRAPSDDKVVKKHLNAIGTWIVRKGVSLAWRQDWTKSGHVHFHVLLTGKLDTTELRQAWHRIIGFETTSNHGVHLRPINNLESARKYLIKPSDSRSNYVPSNYKNMGRFWGCRGHKPKVEATFEGTATEVAPLIRIMRRLSKNARFKDNWWTKGPRNATLWTLGGSELAQSLLRYWIQLRKHSIPDMN